MSETGVTKHVLAYALRDLLKDRPLSKITVGDICTACDMNRKSFYYHFRDKYDLVNWIFYTDFFGSAARDGDRGDVLERMCAYLAKNRTFYQAVLRDRGQNSFYEYLGDVIRPIVCQRMSSVELRGEDERFATDMIVSLYRGMLVEWVCSGEGQDAAGFIRKLYRSSAVLADITPGNR